MAAIDDLIVATTDLLTAVNVSKTTLDNSVSAAVMSAGAASADRIQTGLDVTATQTALADAMANGIAGGQTATCTTFDNKRLTFTNGVLTLVEEL